MLAAPTAQVFACSCIQMNRELALSNADVAFVGVVAAIDDPGGGGPLVGSADLLRYTFLVEEAVKGDPPASLALVSARSGASCGMEFAAAQRWRVFAYVDETRRLQTGLCSGNELLAEGVPIPPISPPAPEAPPVAVLLAIGAAIVLAGISGWAFTRRTRSST
jgi:hypothetical protein